MKHKHYWCPYDPVKKEWWPHWISGTRAALRDMLSLEKEALEGGAYDKITRVKIKKVRLMEVRK